MSICIFFFSGAKIWLEWSFLHGLSLDFLNLCQVCDFGLSRFKANTFISSKSVAGTVSLSLSLSIISASLTSISVQRFPLKIYCPPRQVVFFLKWNIYLKLMWFSFPRTRTPLRQCWSVGSKVSCLMFCIHLVF